MAHGRLNETITLSPIFGKAALCLTAVIVDPGQLAILTAVIEAYRKENGIDPASDEREEVAGLVMKLSCEGIATAEELRTVLLGPLAQRWRSRR